MFNVRKIDNGLIVGVNGADGFKETAFTTDSATYVDDAKAYVTSLKTQVADKAETDAHNRIDSVVSENVTV